MERSRVLVLDTDLRQAGAGLLLAKSARVLDPELSVIYTARMPFRLKDAEKVNGAPCLGVPYRSHQLAGVISQFVRRTVAEEVQVHAA